MAFAAQIGTLPKQAWLLYLATLLWAVAYDTMYSMVDREDDLKLGIKSTAILFGDYDRFMVALFQLMFLAAMILIGLDLGFSAFYYCGLAVAALLLAASAWATTGLAFQWGEPLLHPNFFELVRYAADRGVRTMINDVLAEVNRVNGWDVPIHVDGASGAMVAPVSSRPAPALV